MEPGAPKYCTLVGSKDAEQLRASCMADKEENGGKNGKKGKKDKKGKKGKGGNEGEKDVLDHSECPLCLELNKLTQEENIRRQREEREGERQRCQDDDDDEDECPPQETEKQMLERMVYGLECQVAVMDGRNRELAAKLKRFQLPAGRCKSSPGAPCGTGGWNTYPIDIESVLASYAQTVQRLNCQIERLGTVVAQLDGQMRAAGIKRLGCQKECTYECAATQCPPLGDCVCEKLAWEIIETVKELNVIMEECRLDKKMTDLKNLTKDLQTVK